MTKLLIVDDDEIICRGIATCIDWEKHGVAVVDTAFDGELGLRGVEKNEPDIIIVDINMPFMDGIELSYSVRQKYPHIKIILLTAHKDFYYAQKAVELQVFSYITKPFENDEVLQAVLNAKKSIEIERKYRKELTENSMVLQRKYLAELVCGRHVEWERLAFCGIHAENSLFTVASLFIKSIPIAPENANTGFLNEEVSLLVALDKIEAILMDEDSIHCFVCGEYIVILFEVDTPDASQWETDILTQMISVLGSSDDFYFSCGIGRPCRGVDGIRDSFEEAQTAVGYRFYFSNRSIIHINDVENRVSCEKGNFQSLRRKVLEGVEANDFATIQYNVMALFDEIRQKKDMSMPSVSFWAIELIVAAYNAVQNEEIYESFISDFGSKNSIFIKANDIDEIEQLVFHSLKALGNYLQSQNTNALAQLIKNAVDYIDQNYSDPGLTLKTVADHIHISSSYLCVLFKQYQTISYIAYLNKVRMENAKKLLKRSDIRTYEIAFKVGFNSSQYFASCFKKYTGLTPSDYRDKRRVEDEPI